MQNYIATQMDRQQAERKEQTEAETKKLEMAKQQAEAETKTL